MSRRKLGLVLALATLVLSPLAAHAQLNFTSAIALGGAGNDEGGRVAVDGAGNVYVAGVNSGPVDFDPGPGTATIGVAGPFNAFVAKYSPMGALIWAKNQVAGVAQTHTLAVDAAGNVYTAGWFSGTCDFDPGPGTANFSAISGPNMFVSKLDNAGNFVWGAPMLGGTSTARAMAVDAGGNVYVSGHTFSGTIDFDPGPGNANITDLGNQLFVLKLNSNGTFAWVQNFAGTQALNGNGLALDAAGNVYATANFQGTVDLDPGAGVASFTNGNRDPFVVKLTPAGAFVWAKQFAGGIGAGFGSDIAVDAAGNIHCTGYFIGTVDFNPGAGTANVTSNGSWDVYIAKLDPSGNFLWARNVGGSGQDQPGGIAVDGSNNVYVIGFFSASGDFDPGPATFTLTSNGNDDIFILMLDSSGNFRDAVGIGAASADQGRHIAVTSGGAVYATGYFQGTADFNPGPGTLNLTSAGIQDIFVIGLQAVGGPPPPPPPPGAPPPSPGKEGTYSGSRSGIPAGNEGCYGFGGGMQANIILQGPFVRTDVAHPTTPSVEMMVLNVAPSHQPVRSESPNGAILILGVFAAALAGALAIRFAAG